MIETNGEALSRNDEIFSVLLRADLNTTFFIDEAQGMSSKIQHLLLTAISERKLYLPGSISSRFNGLIPLESFTLILATTHEHLLQNALRNRMRIWCRFTYYSFDALVDIVRQRFNALNWEYESDDTIHDIARRAKGIPRFALNRNLQTCREVAVSHDREIITKKDVCEAFYYLQIDEAGLDSDDRQYLKMLIDFGSLQLSVLSAKLGLEPKTIQNAIEPYLIRENFITKSKSSKRVISEKGIEHINHLSSDYI